MAYDLITHECAAEGVATVAPPARERQGPPWRPGLSRGVWADHPAFGRPTVDLARQVGIGATVARAQNRPQPPIAN